MGYIGNLWLSLIIVHDEFGYMVVFGCRMSVSSWSKGFCKRPPTHKIPSIRAGSSLITWLDFLTFFVSIRDDHWSGKLPICTTSMISLSADFNSSTFRGLVFFSLWGGECLPCFRLTTAFLQAILESQHPTHDLFMFVPVREPFEHGLDRCGSSSSGQADKRSSVYI